MNQLYNLLDQGIADALNVDVETYIDIIDSKCTEDEATFIIMSILENNEHNIEKAKQTFNSYLKS